MHSQSAVLLLLGVSLLSVEAPAQPAGLTTGFETVRNCSEFGGADAGAKISACIASLPSTGGTADARGLEGPLIIGQTVSDSGKNVEILLGAATYSATVHPAFSCSGGGSITIRGRGKAQTQIAAANAPGDVVSKTCSGWFVLEDLTINGNATADSGIHIDGSNRPLNNYTLNRVAVSGFKKPSLGAALRITGANSGTFIDSDFNASTIGVDCTTRTTGAGSCNLNRFLGGHIGRNTRHVWIHNAGATDSPSGNTFQGVNFEFATVASSIYIQRGSNNNFIYNWFESDAAGTALIQVGNSADSLDNPIGTIIEGNNFTEGSAGPITYLVQIQRGKSTKVVFNRDSQLANDSLVRNESNARETIVWGNSNNSPPAAWPLSDGSESGDGWEMGPGTTMRKTSAGFALTVPLSGIATTPLRARTPQPGTAIVQWVGASGNVVGQVDENGHQSADGAPTLGSCGSSSSIAGNDHAMKIQAGVGSVTNCVVHFFAPWKGDTPICIAADQTDEARRVRTATTASELTITSSSSFAGDVIDVICYGRL
jgi:hypothetical protein